MKILIPTLLLLLAAGQARSAGSLSPNTNLTAREEQIVAAAQPGGPPRFNGARVFGIHPRTPFLQSSQVTGDRPLVFSVKHLPRGFKFDPVNGIISGSLDRPGEHRFAVRASNPAGSAEAEFHIVSGSQLALLPPMGWNSYDAFGDAVTEDEVLANAAWMKKHLQPLGWDYVVVDFRWYDSKADGVRAQDPEGIAMDEYGRCIPAANRFPSAANGAGFAPLAAQIHALGLKFGIHIMRGIPRKAVEQNLPIAGSPFHAVDAVLPATETNRTCPWNRDMFGVAADTDAGRAWYASIVRQYAGWGVDYVKCDDIANEENGQSYGAAEVEALSESLRGSGRSILLSLSPGPAHLYAGPHMKRFANLWRISGDFWDNWRVLNRNFDLFASWLPDAGPGHWPDGDMIPLGHICLRNCDVRPERWTRLIRNEQLTLMSLWVLAPSPLMLGMNLPDNDPWTTAILTNPEVLAVDQDPLGRPAERRPGPQPATEIWSKELADGSLAVGLFNRAEQAVQIDFPWRHLGFVKPLYLRDLWLRRDLAPQARLTSEVPPHGCLLMVVKRAVADR